MPVGRPKGIPNKASKVAAQRAREVIDAAADKGYFNRLTTELAAGSLPTEIEKMLWSYAYGRPRETVEITTPGDQPLVMRIERVIVDKAADMPIPAPENDGDSAELMH